MFKWGIRARLIVNYLVLILLTMSLIKIETAALTSAMFMITSLNEVQNRIERQNGGDNSIFLFLSLLILHHHLSNCSDARWSPFVLIIIIITTIIIKIICRMRSNMIRGAL